MIRENNELLSRLNCTNLELLDFTFSKQSFYVNVGLFNLEKIECFQISNKF